MSQNDQHDQRDQEVRTYVRNRMAGEIPPEFVGDVMNDVVRTNQRRRGPVWPILTGLATAAAAVAIVIVGLGVIDQDGVGVQPTPSATASATASAEPTASASAEATASPSAEATTGAGEFGPIHFMAPEEAFANGQACESTGVITTVGGQTDISYRISFPDDWHTNDATDARSACTLFAPEAFEARDDQSIPETVAIAANLPPGGDFGSGGSAVTPQQYTVDGVAAIRYDIEPEAGGFTTEGTIVWIIAVADSLPAEGNDQPYLALSTASSDPDEFAAHADVLDRMVATLRIGGE